jgi:hypothetical protein
VRFKNVGPDVLEFREDVDGVTLESGVWFDWPLVEFIRNSYRTFAVPFIPGSTIGLILLAVSVQRAILLDPGAAENARKCYVSLYSPSVC